MSNLKLQGNCSFKLCIIHLLAPGLVEQDVHQFTVHFLDLTCLISEVTCTSLLCKVLQARHFPSS